MMIRPGALLLRARQKLAHGPRVSFWRELYRPRILHTPGVRDLDDDRCEIHVLTSGQDWLNAIWTLKSFYAYSGCRYRLCIHDDGSLAKQQAECLRTHFPDSRHIAKQEADETAQERLRKHPRCLSFRQSNHLAPKVFDFLFYLDSPRLMLMDSDVLFFDRPVRLLECAETDDCPKNKVNRDVASAYTTTPDLVRERTGIELITGFNSGLGILHAASLKLDWFEEFLGLPGIEGHFWRIEQTLLALVSSRFGVELLPPEYDVFLKGDLGDRCSRHYVGSIRHLFYGEGIRRLHEQGFFKTLEHAARSS